MVIRGEHPPPEPDYWCRRLSQKPPDIVMETQVGHSCADTVTNGDISEPCA